MMSPRFLRRLRARIKYRYFDRDLAREIEVHRGMAERETGSRYEASRQLGNVTLAREDSRAMWIPTLLQQLLQDAHYALRGLRRAPAFAASAIFMLTVGLGLVSGGYTLINGIFLRGWNLPASADVFTARFARDPETRNVEGPSLGAYRHLQANARVADYVFHRTEYSRIGADSAARGEHTEGAIVSPNFVETLQIPLQRGTGLAQAGSTSTPAVVISHGIWQRVFGGDPAIIGRTAWLRGKAATVVGVTARHFDGLANHSLGFIIDIEAARQLAPNGVLELFRDDTKGWVGALAGRIRDSRTRDDVRQEMQLLFDRYRQSVRQQPVAVEVKGTAPGESLGEARNGAAIQLALALIGVAVLLIMLLTFANVGNLYLARSLRREREIAVRLSLGASRARVVRQLVTEGLVLAAISGTGAFVLTMLTPFVMQLIEDDFTVSMLASDWRVALFTAMGVVVACLVVSLAPALQTTRIARRGANVTTSRASGRMRGVVLAAQISIAAVLVLSAALVTRGIHRGLTTRDDFALHTTTVTKIRPAAGKTYTEGQIASMAQAFKQAVAGSDLRPGVIEVGGSATGGRLGIGGVELKVKEAWLRADLVPLSTAAAAVLELHLVAGRWMADDRMLRQAVVNEALARSIEPHGQAVGQEFELFHQTYTVVGIARDAHLTALGDVEPTIHIAPGLQISTFVTRTAPGVDEKMQAMAASVDSDLVVTSVPLSQNLRDTLEAATIGATIAGIFAVIALLLAVVGIFGVFTYLIEERRSEIGIRLALGASRRQIAAALYRACRGPVVGGLAAGLVMSAIAGFALRGVLFGLSPTDPVSYLAVGVVLALAALVATAIPVRRALRTDPAVTLRAE